MIFKTEFINIFFKLIKSEFVREKDKKLFYLKFSKLLITICKFRSINRTLHWSKIYYLKQLRVNNTITKFQHKMPVHVEKQTSSWMKHFSSGNTLEKLSFHRETHFVIISISRANTSITFKIRARFHSKISKGNPRKVVS